MDKIILKIILSLLLPLKRAGQNNEKRNRAQDETAGV